MYTFAKESANLRTLSSKLRAKYDGLYKAAVLISFMLFTFSSKHYAVSWCNVSRELLFMLCKIKHPIYFDQAMSVGQLLALLWFQFEFYYDVQHVRKTVGVAHYTMIRVSLRMLNILLLILCVLDFPLSISQSRDGLLCSCIFCIQYLPISNQPTARFFIAQSLVEPNLFWAQT